MRSPTHLIRIRPVLLKGIGLPRSWTERGAHTQSVTSAEPVVPDGNPAGHVVIASVALVEVYSLESDTSVMCTPLYNLEHVPVAKQGRDTNAKLGAFFRQNRGREIDFLPMFLPVV